MHTLLLGSRKGLFTVRQHAPGQWKIEQHHFAGEPVSQVLAAGGTWYAALRLGHFGVKLHKSTDAGERWQEIACPKLPEKPAQGPWADDKTPWTVDMIWALAAGGKHHPQRLWAGCNPAAMFRSDDAGASWTLCESFWLDARRSSWFGGGYDHAGIHSIVVDPRDGNRVTAAISCGGVWQTTNAGQDWQLVGKGMINTYMPPEQQGEPNTQDPHCIAACTAQPDTMWMQHHCGIFSSSDAGHHWRKVATPDGVSDFGFPVAVHPANPMQAWFAPAQADSHRYPPGASMYVSRTDDGGKTFHAFRAGLPQTHAFDLVYRHGLQVAGDGHTLAMASTTGSLWVSEDAGESWLTLATSLPPVAVVQFAQ